ncbi:hypothetical protein F4859DRAFT_413934 [Xylaria cf. heliscus]|nr:hypothetical protein F4859DRAFT_413934 [Xylaria cf. heliscus]
MGSSQRSGVQLLLFLLLLLLFFAANSVMPNATHCFLSPVAQKNNCIQHRSHRSTSQDEEENPQHDKKKEDTK